MGVTITAELGEGDLHPVPWRDGLTLPAHWAPTIDDSDSPYIIRLELEMRDAEPTVISLALAAREGGPPVSARALRDVRVASYVRLAAASKAAGIQAEREESLGLETVAFRSGPPFEEVAGQAARRRITNEFLREVSRVYQEAPRKPAKAVQEHPAWAPVHRGTVARWLRLARDGIDPETGERFLPQR